MSEDDIEIIEIKKVDENAKRKRTLNTVKSEDDVAAKSTKLDEPSLIIREARRTDPNRQNPPVEPMDTTAPSSLDPDFAEKAYANLRRELFDCTSFWSRKTKLLTAQTDKSIAPLKLKLLQLELGLHFKSAQETVLAVNDLQKNHSDNEEFRKRIEQLNNYLEDNKTTPFAKELLGQMNLDIFLGPILLKSQTSITKLQTLISLTNTVGIEKVGRKIFELYTDLRIKSLDKNISSFDMIWFNLFDKLCDSDNAGLTPDNIFVIYRAMLMCCVSDTRSSLPDEFFAISDGLGFLRVRPKDSWLLCLRLLTNLLSLRQGDKLSSMVHFMKRRMQTGISILRASEELIKCIDIKQDDEIARFLLTYAASMRSSVEGDQHILLVPGRIFEMSEHAVSTYWMQNNDPRPEVDADEIEFKEALDDKADLYRESMRIARNVYTAYQAKMSGSMDQIESNLRQILQNLDLSNAFSTIGQSLLFAGKFSDAAKFTSRAILATKDKDEQNYLSLQYFSANILMREIGLARNAGLDLLSNGLVNQLIENSVGVLQNSRFENDTFIRIDKESVYDYVALMLLHSAIIAFAQAKKDNNNKMMSMAATIAILSVQCCWDFCANYTRDLFDLVNNKELSMLNIARMFSSAYVFSRLLDARVTFKQGSETPDKMTLKRMFREEYAKGITRTTPFNNLVVFCKSVGKK